jgi:dTDP-6-deoxy-L-talose 4-dehydrogenase (NAD+)
MKKKILVTGASGFLGRHIVHNLVSKKFKVIALVRNINKAKKIKELKKASIIHFDISKKQAIPLPKNCALIHCAWDDVRNIFSKKHLGKHYKNQYNFLNKIIAHGIKKIIVTGTSFEYGLQYGPIFVSSKAKPNTPYAKSKDLLHKNLLKLKSKINFHLIWTRIFYIYGNGQNPKSVMGLFDKALKKNKKKFNMSFGDQLHDYQPVEKAAEQIVKLLKYNKGIFNICSGQPISLRRLLELRMKEQKKKIKLNLGYYNYKKDESIAIWGGDPIN